jgi:hypothetical protein
MEKPFFPDHAHFFSKDPSMSLGYRHLIRNFERILFPAAVLLGALVSEPQAQWAWAKSVGISGATVWKAAALRDNGDIWFGGVSDKLPGTGASVRGFVMARYSDTLAAKWNTRILGGNGSYAGETCLGVDSAGGSYLLDKWQDTPLILPDSSQISYFLASYFVSRYEPDGKLAWAKKLVLGGIRQFQVMSDGTLGIVAKGVVKTYIFGNDTIQGAADGADSYFIEIKPDGAIGRSVASSGVNRYGMVFAQWKEPGKVFAVMSDQTTLGTDYYHRGVIDLDGKTYAEDGTPLKVEGTPNTFRWENNGYPNSPTTVLEPKSGHLFALMSVIGGNGNTRLNGGDTLVQQTSTQVKDGYVVELDDQMKVARKIHLTNPLTLAVRDSQVVVTAIVRATSDFGFVTPDTTLKITQKAVNIDGYVTYIMDRDFKYKKHGLVEGTQNTTLAPSLNLIDPDGGIYLVMQSGGDMTYQGLPVLNRGRVLGTVVSKIGVAPSSSLKHFTKAAGARMRMNADGRLILDRPGRYRYVLTNLHGGRIAAGEGSGRAVCDMSGAPVGLYVLTLQEREGTSFHVVRKLDR